MWRLVLLALPVAFLVAAKLLPWWGTLALLAGLIVTGKLLGKTLLEAAFTAPFKAKGRVLRGAAADVHSVAPAEAPADREAPEDPEEPDTPRRWYTLDVTIRPNAASARPGGFTLWEPGELILVRPEARDPRQDDDEEDHVARVEHLEIQQDGAFVTDDGWKLPGPQRLRMLVGVRPDVARLKFRYYFENFGEVRLP